MASVSKTRLQTVFNKLEVLRTAIEEMTYVLESIEDDKPELILSVHPTGAVKLAEVEDFRKSFVDKAETADEEALRKRFVESLPVWWFVQDAEDYVPDYTAGMNFLQEFNCSRARFTASLTGGNDTHELLWRTWAPAIILKEDPRQDISTVIEEPLFIDGQRVYALANDSVVNGRSITNNPRVENIVEVIENAYDYFYMTNKDAQYNINEIPRVEPVARDRFFLRDSYLAAGFKEYVRDNYRGLEREAIYEDPAAAQEAYLSDIVDAADSAKDVTEAKNILRDEFGHAGN